MLPGESFFFHLEIMMTPIRVSFLTDLAFKEWKLLEGETYQDSVIFSVSELFCIISDPHSVACRNDWTL